MFLNSGIQTYQILTNDDEVCILSLSIIILLAVHKQMTTEFLQDYELNSDCRKTAEVS